MPLSSSRAKAIRKSLGVTKSRLATAMDVELSEVIAWEKPATILRGPASVLLERIGDKPYLLEFLEGDITREEMATKHRSHAASVWLSGEVH